MDPKRLRDIDHGWAWMVMVASCMTQVVIGMLIYSYGVIQVVFLDTFQQRLVDTTWILSIAGSLVCFPGPLVGILTNLTSCRTTMMIGSILIFVGLTASAFVTNLGHLYLTLAVVTGLGTGIVYTPSLVVLGFYFDKHLGIATGFAVTGGGIGMMVGPPLTSYIVDNYGWRGMFLLLAGLLANVCVCSLICRPSVVERSYASKKHEPALPSILAIEKAKTSDEENQSSSWYASLMHTNKLCAKAVFSLSMTMYSSSVFLWSITISIVMLYLPSFTVEHGATTAQSSLLFTIMGICNVVSRSTAGVFVNSGKMDKFCLYFGSFGLMAILTLAFPFISNTFTTSLVYAGLFGVFTGGPYVVLTTITKDLVGLRHLSIAYGVEMLVSGTGMMVGPPMAGLMVEATGSYTWSFVLAGSTCFLSSFLGMMLKVCHKPCTGFEMNVEPSAQGENQTPLPVGSQLDIGSQLRLGSQFRLGSQLHNGSQSRLGSLLRMASLGASQASLPSIGPYMERSASQFIRTHPQYISQSTLNNEATHMMPNGDVDDNDCNEVISSR